MRSVPASRFRSDHLKPKASPLRVPVSARNKISRYHLVPAAALSRASNCCGLGPRARVLPRSGGSAWLIGLLGISFQRTASFIAEWLARWMLWIVVLLSV